MYIRYSGFPQRLKEEQFKTYIIINTKKDNYSVESHHGRTEINVSKNGKGYLKHRANDFLVDTNTLRIEFKLKNSDEWEILK